MCCYGHMAHGTSQLYMYTNLYTTYTASGLWPSIVQDLHPSILYMYLLTPPTLLMVHASSHTIMILYAQE